MRKTAVALSVSMLLTFSVSGGEQPQPPEHIVILLADTLRADHVGAYGAENCRTPNIDSLAEEGLLFRNALTVFPGSAPSYAAMFTALLPFEHGVTNNAMPLPADLPYLPETLYESGFHTAGFVSNYYCSEKFGFDRGFATFMGPKEVGKHSWTVSEKLLPWLEDWDPAQQRLFLFVAYMDLHVPYSLPYLPDWLQFRFNGRKVGKRACPELEPDQRITLSVPPGTHRFVLHRMIPPLRPWWNPDYRVTPYPWSGLIKAGVQVEFTDNVTDRREDAQSGTVSWLTTGFPVVASLTNPTRETITGHLELGMVRRYDPEQGRTIFPRTVEYLDHEIGRILEILREKGVLDRTMVMVLSDHGESLGEHGLRGHIENLHDPTMRIPLILRYPPLGKGKVNEELVSIADITPTLAGLLGREWESNYGRSLLPMLMNGGEPPHRWLFSETYRPEAGRRMTSLRTLDTKLILNLTDNKIEFFDLKADPGEVRNLYKPGDVAAEQAIASYLDIFKLTDPFEEPSVPEILAIETLSPEELEKLRALGYIQ